MNRELSVLLPVYECSCVTLVTALHEQCTLAGIDFEIIVADDGSSTPATITANRQIEQLPNVRYIIRSENVGRAAIRNFLVSQAHFERVLFCDGDMELRKAGFINNYLSADAPIVYGGYSLEESPDHPTLHNLRYRYEVTHKLNHTPAERSKHPYHDFHTSNFLARRQILVDHPFDERFQHYGYEDVLWGKTLQQNGIAILHIDNPLCFCHFEDNEHFVGKTEEGLRTLYTFRDELKGFSSLLNIHTALSSTHFPHFLRHLTRFSLLYVYKIAGKSIRKRLIHNKMPLFVFNIYRLLYFVHLDHSGR